MLAEYDLYDDRLAPIFSKYDDLKHQRQSVAESLGAFSAAVVAQQYYNSLAQTDLDAHSNFIVNVRAFHAELKVTFYTKIYRNQPFRQSDFAKIPMYQASGNEPASGTYRMLILLVLNVLVVWGIAVLWKR